MSHFFAYLSRMKLIERWSLMRSTYKENVQEHSLQVAIIAHSLAVIKNKFFGGQVDANRVAVLAIYHDATEVMTGDLPTPVKYFTNDMKVAYQSLEKHAVGQLLKLLPEELVPEYADLLHIGPKDAELKGLIKAADTLSAYIKCLEEKAAGNKEFIQAQKTIEEKLAQYEAPEVQYFLKNFIPSFSLTIDDMSSPLSSPDVSL